MKQKTTIRFDDYKVDEPSADAIARCIDSATYRLADQSIRSYSLWRALLVQIRYISPLFWAMQAAAIALLILLGIGANPQYRMMLAAFGPALMAISAPELAKSHAHGMWELESSAVYSLPRLTSIRLFIVGSIDLIALGCVSFALRGRLNLHPVDQLFLTAAPFLLGSLVNFAVLDRMRGQLGSAICAACALLIGIVAAALTDAQFSIPHMMQLSILLVATALCAWQAIRFAQHEGRIPANAAYH